MQEEVQHQAVEDLHRLLQLPPAGRHHRREDLLLPRRSLTRPAVHGADQEDHAAHRRPRPGFALRPLVVGPRQGSQRLGRERQRCFVHVRRRGGGQVLAQARPRPHLPRAPGRRGRLRVLRQAAAGDPVQRAQLLRRVRQRGSHDVGGRDADVLLPDFEAGRQEEVPVRGAERGQAGHPAQEQHGKEGSGQEVIRLAGWSCSAIFIGRWIYQRDSFCFVNIF